MGKKYGTRTKYVRHVTEDDITIEPQRFYVCTLWRHYQSATRTDGQDVTDKYLSPGAKVMNHKLEIRVTPETIEPQQIYMGRIKLSFHDILASPICGGEWDQASYQDTSTENFAVTSNAITPQLYPDTGNQSVEGADTANREIGGSGSGYGIQDWKLDDDIHHFINLKKVTVFDQRPLIGERWQRIPSKVKVGNPYTYYGLFFFNDSPRGATPADTQVKINIKSYFDEKSIT